MLESDLIKIRFFVFILKLKRTETILPNFQKDQIDENEDNLPNE